MQFPTPHDRTPSNVGLVGIGLMGRALAERLTSCGRVVVGFDISEDRRKSFCGLDNTILASRVEDVFEQCRVVVLSLPTHREVAEVLGQCRDYLEPGQIIIDSTTGDPESAKRFALDLGRRNVFYLDGTIAGSSEQARRADVVWMVGGDRTAYDQCLPLIRQCAKDVFYCGPAGSGSTMKLVVNLALGLNRAALAESLALAERLHLDPRQTLEILRSGTAYSRIMDTKGEKMLERTYAPQARLAQHLKDVRLIVAAGARANLPLPLSEAHQKLLELAEEMGLGVVDNSALIEVYRQSAKGNHESRSSGDHRPTPPAD